MLQVQDIKKTFFPKTVNEKRALMGVDLNLADGDFVTVIGSNGAGKSTLLNAVSGKMPIDTGDILINGKSVRRMPDYRRAKYIGRVFQDPMAGTAPDLSIEQNLALALRRGQSRGLGLGITPARRELFREELQSLDLGLEKRMTSKVGLLSGGQRQALSLLMAGFTKPAILLLDEHTAALDPTRAAHVTELTRRIVDSEKLTTLMVTHNMHQAIDLGNRLIMMHEGRIIYEVAGDAKANTTVDELLARFAAIKGAVVDDKTMLS
ncbi:ABC transporter ATP-binding protein [Gulosibacter macacae]|uniref:ABC transporter ATP-binding protein n=1 Tax=Gulosibacter macacae TaxID=2488791 RepID=A0A3P3W0Y4_9MICO|nr:ABC transporter ATP-binding protein [Gulosibacter macacae]RRJ88630.1 ABC transporter ATP-binding protein [Gulosibacter macacae]